MSYFTFNITSFKIKSQMKMFTQPSQSMGFCMWTTKLQWLKLRWSTWNFYWFVLYIFSVLDMLLMIRPFTLTSSFPALTMINQSIHMGWIWRMLLKYPSYNGVCILIVVWMTIYELLVAAPGSCKIVINIVRKLFPVALKPSTTYLPCPSDPTTR